MRRFKDSYADIQSCHIAMREIPKNFNALIG